MSLLFTTHVECNGCRDRFLVATSRMPERRLARIEAAIRGWMKTGGDYFCKKCHWRAKITTADVLPIGRVKL